MINKWPILVINLDRSVDRMEQMRLKFPDEDLVRIAGVDGRIWQDGDRVSQRGRPLWKEGMKKSLQDTGVLGEPSMFPLIPAEVGCALGHKKAWEHIIRNNIKCAIVLEDDIEPTGLYNGSLQDSLQEQLPMPSDADVVFLTGEDSEQCLVQTDKKSRLLFGQCNFGYVITLKGAMTALMAQFPMYMPCDFQWWALAFKGIGIYIAVSDSGIDKGYAYAVDKSIIKISDLGMVTTMTNSGEKPWRRVS